MFDDGGRLGDARGIVHKRLLGAVGGLIGGGPLGAAAGFVKAGGRGVTKRRPPARPTIPRGQTARPSAASEAEKNAGRNVKFGDMGTKFSIPGIGPAEDGCVFPFRRDPRTGDCKIFLGERSGPDDAPRAPRGPRGPSGPVGDAVMGLYGAALQPGTMAIERSVCLRGMQLGDDGLCYNKGHLRNNQRMWPRGRRPLLTGGDMRAIGIASRAGKKVEAATKRLRTLGMMKTPTPRKAIAAAKTVVVHEHDPHHHTTH